MDIKLLNENEEKVIAFNCRNLADLIGQSKKTTRSFRVSARLCKGKFFKRLPFKMRGKLKMDATFTKLGSTQFRF